MSPNETAKRMKQTLGDRWSYAIATIIAGLAVALVSGAAGLALGHSTEGARQAQVDQDLSARLDRMQRSSREQIGALAGSIADIGDDVSQIRAEMVTQTEFRQLGAELRAEQRELRDRAVRNTTRIEILEDGRGRDQEAES